MTNDPVLVGLGPGSVPAVHAKCTADRLGSAIRESKGLGVILLCPTHFLDSSCRDRPCRDLGFVDKDAQTNGGQHPELRVERAAPAEEFGTQWHGGRQPPFCC